MLVQKCVKPHIAAPWRKLLLLLRLDFSPFFQLGIHNQRATLSQTV